MCPRYAFYHLLSPSVRLCSEQHLLSAACWIPGSPNSASIKFPTVITNFKHLCTHMHICTQSRMGPHTWLHKHTCACIHVYMCPHMDTEASYTCLRIHAAYIHCLHIHWALYTHAYIYVGYVQHTYICTDAPYTYAYMYNEAPIHTCLRTCVAYTQHNTHAYIAIQSHVWIHAYTHKMHVQSCTGVHIMLSVQCKHDQCVHVDMWSY